MCFANVYWLDDIQNSVQKLAVVFNAFFGIPSFHSHNINGVSFLYGESTMFRFLKCLFGLHGATEVDYTIDNEEIKVCRDCLKEVK